MVKRFCIFYKNKIQSQHSWWESVMTFKRRLYRFYDMAFLFKYAMNNNQIHINSNSINLPLELLLASKDDESLELLCLSLFMKYNFGDSLIRCSKVSDIRNILHCNHYKAENILNRAKSSDLFIYNAKSGNLWARSITRMYEKKGLSKRGHKMVYGLCFKIKFDNNTTLKGLKKELKEQLIANKITQQSSKIDFSKARIKNNFSISSNDGYTRISQTQLAKSAGLKNRQAVSRVIKSMTKSGKISTIKHEYKLVSSSVSNEAIENLNISLDDCFVTSNNVALKVISKGYKIETNEIKAVNIIYNHKKRFVDSKVKSTNFVDRYYEMINH